LLKDPAVRLKQIEMATGARTIALPPTSSTDFGYPSWSWWSLSFWS